MEKENFEVITENQGRYLLEKKPIFIMTLIEQKIDMKYIKNIVAYLKKKEENSLIVSVISVFGENEDKKDKILNESLEELKKEVESIIIVPNNAKKYSEAEEILENAVKKISSFTKGMGFINLDVADMLYFFEENKISIYGFGSAEGENKVDEVREKIVLSIPEKYRKNIGKILLSEETSADIGLVETQETVEYVEEELEIRERIGCTLLDISINPSLKNKINIMGLFGLKEI